MGRSYSRLFFPLLFAFLSILIFSSRGGAEDHSPSNSESISSTLERSTALDSVINSATIHQLARSREWLNLLHFQPRMWVLGSRSLVDDETFFLSPEGATDPELELQATLRAFSQPIIEGDEDKHPQCRFVARYRYLRENLPLEQAIDSVKCPRFQEWIAALNPQSVTLVFPSAYLNNPASMFGHTFLRIDPSPNPGRDALLGYGVSYAAQIDDGMGFLFAIKGLLGGYRGYFNILPYYLQVKRYGDFENRDLWEYELNFTPQESERLLEHLWELRSVNFDYFFFDENCSYHILSLLEVGRPKLHITDRFQGWVIPVDTVRAITEEPELVSAVVYRPAAATTLNYRRGIVDPAVMPLAMELATGPENLVGSSWDELPPSTAAEGVDLALDYLEYLELSGRVEEGRAEEVRHELFKRRSILSPPRTPRPPKPETSPDRGHSPLRFSLGLGVNEQHGFSEIELRPAYHETMDPGGGYTKGASIQFADLTLRQVEEEKLKVESFNLLDIRSLSPRDELLRPISWHLSLGAQRVLREDDSRSMISGLNGGPGLTWEWTPALWFYLLSDLSFVAGEFLDDRLALGYGAEGGMVLWGGEKFRMSANGSASRFVGGDEFNLGSLKFELQRDLTTGLALGLSLERVVSFENYETVGSIALHWYY